MDAGSPSLSSQQQILTSKIKTLINHDLREICRGENLAVSGVKVTLQQRILQHLDSLVAAGNVTQLDVLRHRIYNHGMAPSSLTHSLSSSLNLPTPNPATARMTSSSTNPPPPYGANSFGMAAPALGIQRPRFPTPLRFKESPFYQIEEPLADTLSLAGEAKFLKNPGPKNTVQITVRLTDIWADRLRKDSSLRVLLYSASEPLPHGAYHASDIVFPPQLEVKVNTVNDVKANFKGLKNKVGSTLPADITGFIKKQATPFANIITITYALTNKKYWVVPMLVKKHSVEELAERIRKRSVISKEKVIREMVTKASDPDIEATSVNMSLKDPTSLMRLSLPTRSIQCTHNQCFDAICFLQLQEQAPTWTCPICQKAVGYEGLAVDQYVQEILQHTPNSIGQVTIEPSGKWTYAGHANWNSASNGVKHEEDSDSDDLVEVITKPFVKSEAPNTPLSLNMTPAAPSPGSATSAPRAGQKRKSEVIDLTLDDDDEPAPKRPAHGANVSQVRNGYQSLSRSNSSHTPHTNGVSFQLGRSIGVNNGRYSSPATHNSALAGSPLAPITISSSPHGPTSQVRDYSTLPSFQTPQPRQPSHHSPPVHNDSQNGTSNPYQRATLLGLAGRNPNHGSQ